MLSWRCAAEKAQVQDVQADRDRRPRQPEVPRESREFQSACREKPAIFPAGRRMAISSANCRVAGMLSYLDPASTEWTSGALTLRRYGSEARRAGRRSRRARCPREAWCELSRPAFAPVPTAQSFVASCAAFCVSSAAWSQMRSRISNSPNFSRAIKQSGAWRRSFAQLLHRFLRLQIDAERHAQQHANLGNVAAPVQRRSRSCAIRSRALFWLQHAWIAEHALQKTRRSRGQAQQAMRRSGMRERWTAPHR